MSEEITISRESFFDTFAQMKNQGSNITENLKIDGFPGRSFPSVQEKFEVLQRVCNTLDNYRAFLETDIERFKEFGEAFFELDISGKKAMMETSESSNPLILF